MPTSRWRSSGSRCAIDHAILKALVARKIKDPHVLWLVDRIIDHSNPQDPVLMWFPGDDLFTPTERRRGLALGNQTSQFFANVYLDGLDHFVTDRLGLSYVRYVFEACRCKVQAAVPCRASSVSLVVRPNEAQARRVL
jgi:hypothetical protein